MQQGNGREISSEGKRNFACVRTNIIKIYYFRRIQSSTSLNLVKGLTVGGFIQMYGNVDVFRTGEAVHNIPSLCFRTLSNRYETPSDPEICETRLVSSRLLSICFPSSLLRVTSRFHALRTRGLLRALTFPPRLETYFSIDPFSKKKSFPRGGSNNYGENNFHRTYSSKGVSINFIKNKFSPLFDISSSSVSLSSNAPPTRRVIDPWREFYFSQLRDSARF